MATIIAGEHHAMPAGGDRGASPGAQNAGAGAYAGSLVGALGRMDQDTQPGQDSVRPAETLVAVNADAAGCTADEVVRLFEECGARQVERTEGRWEDGAWADFDPLSPPQLVGGRDLREPPARGASPPA